jgi:hypothetical protein
MGLTWRDLCAVKAISRLAVKEVYQDVTSAIIIVALLVHPARPEINHVVHCKDETRVKGSVYQIKCKHV